MSRQVTPDTPEVVAFRDIRVGDLVEDMNGVPYEVLKVEWTDRTTPLLLLPLDHMSTPRWDYSLNAPFILIHRP